LAVLVPDLRAGRPEQRAAAARRQRAAIRHAAWFGQVNSPVTHSRNINRKQHWQMKKEKSAQQGKTAKK
jgi:hypothetical protein